MGIKDNPNQNININQIAPSDGIEHRIYPELFRKLVILEAVEPLLSCSPFPPLPNVFVQKTIL